MKSLWKYLLGVGFLLPVSLSAQIMGGAHVTGTITTTSPAAGTPVRDAKVVLVSTTSIRLDSTTSDSLGRYSLNGVTAGAFYTIEASKSNYATNSGTLNLAPADTAKTVNVTITGLGADVTGAITATNAAGASVPVAGAKVLLLNGRVRSDSAITDASGNYRLINIHVPSGAYYTMEASKKNYIGTLADLQLAPAQLTATLNIKIVGVGTVTGHVTAVGGTPAIVGAKVVLITGGVRVDSTSTDGTGLYYFPDFGKKEVIITLAKAAASSVFPPKECYYADSGYVCPAAYNSSTAFLWPSVGPHNVEFSSTGYLTVNLATSIPTPGATATLDAVQLPAGSISGTVQTTALVAIPNVMVRLRTGSATGTVIDSTLSNAQGVYTFANVQARAGYFLTATYGVNISVASPTQTVAASATTTYNFLMTITAAGTITGIVSDANGPVVGATVAIRRGAATTPILLTVTTDATGRYTFIGVTTGTSSTNNNYTVIGSAAGHTTVTSTPNIAVTNTTAVTRNITLPITVVSLRAALSAQRQGLRFSRLGDQLVVDLNVSAKVRIVEVFGLNGATRYRVAVPAGETRAMLPVSLSPANGFMVRVK